MSQTGIFTFQQKGGINYIISWPPQLKKKKVKRFLLFIKKVKQFLTSHPVYMHYKSLFFF